MTNNEHLDSFLSSKSSNNKIDTINELSDE